MTRDVIVCDVLALGVGAEASAVDALDPRGAAHRQTEEQHEAREKEAHPPLDHGVRA